MHVTISDKDGNITPVAFNELDRNGDGRLLAHELNNLKAIQIGLSLEGKTKKTEFVYFSTFPKRVVVVN